MNHYKEGPPVREIILMSVGQLSRKLAAPALYTSTVSTPDERAFGSAPAGELNKIEVGHVTPVAPYARLYRPFGSMQY
jgi:hypothetical protein